MTRIRVDLRAPYPHYTITERPQDRTVGAPSGSTSAAGYGMLARNRSGAFGGSEGFSYDPMAGFGFQGLLMGADPSVQWVRFPSGVVMRNPNYVDPNDINKGWWYWMFVGDKPKRYTGSAWMFRGVIYGLEPTIPYVRVDGIEYANQAYFMRPQYTYKTATAGATAIARRAGL